MKLDHEKKKTLICFFLLIVCVVMLVVSIMHLSDLPLHRFVGTRKSATENLQDMKAVKIDGERYLPRDNMSVYLVIGIDKDGEMKGTGGTTNHEQSDFLMLLIFDHIKQTYSVLNINRDTIAYVPQLGLFGDKIDGKNEQLALAHTYGDGMDASCRNTVDAVSGFLYQAKIDAYFCVTMSALPVLNEYLGGVTVTFDKDYTELDPAFVKGTSIKMSNEQAYTFIRARATASEPTNVARMARQKLYMESAANEIKKNTSASALLGLLSDLSPYLLTNYNVSDTETASRILSNYTYSGSVTPEGESKVENGFMAFYADEEPLKKYVIETFYDKLD